jgi:predicted amidohydrolase
MNAKIERAMNSENLDVRLMRNRALDQKIWALEASRGKNSLFRRFWGNSGIFGVVGGSWRKRQGLLRSLGIFQGFFGILEGLKCFKTYLY